jgi:hypothetical protein
MAARTAVVAGTATAVSGGVMRHQQRKAEQQYEAQQYELQQQAAAMGAPQQQYAAPQQYAPQAYEAPPAPAAPAAGGTDMVAELQQLATLKAQGVLSDAEFEAAKAKLLS